MQKESTLNTHRKIANEAMYYIYQHIDTDINIGDLALSFNVSKFHLHKIFKEQMKINIYESIKSIRLQKASNLLLTNKHSTITKIANTCGYSSQTSFIRAFKKRFDQSPGVWRKGGYKEYSKKILENSKLSFYDNKEFNQLEVTIVKAPYRKTYYIRQKGYKRDEIKKTWQKLIAWAHTNNIKEYEQVGIYHDNPVITSHDKCFYIAAIVPIGNYNLEHTNLPSFTMPDDLYANFNILGKSGNILRFIQWAYHEWLPNSGYETITEPSFTILKKNHFLDNKGEIDASFYLPIKFI